MIMDPSEGDVDLPDADHSCNFMNSNDHDVLYLPIADHSHNDKDDTLDFFNDNDNDNLHDGDNNDDKENGGDQSYDHDGDKGSAASSSDLPIRQHQQRHAPIDGSSVSGGGVPI